MIAAASTGITIVALFYCVAGIIWWVLEERRVRRARRDDQDVFVDLVARWQHPAGRSR